MVIARLANFAVQLGLTDSELFDALAQGLERHVIYRLLGKAAAVFVGRLGPFEQRTQELVVNPLVENALAQLARERRAKGATGVPGGWLTRDVLGWLFPLLPEPVQIEPGLDIEGLRLPAELAAQLVLSRAESPMYADRRPLALWLSLAESPRRAFPPELDVYFSGPPWQPYDLAVLEHAFPDRIPIALLERSIITAPTSPPLIELCELLLRRSQAGYNFAPDPAFGMVKMRLTLAATPSWSLFTGTVFFDELEKIMRGGAYAARVGAVSLPSDVVESLRIATMVSAVAELHQAESGIVKPVLGDPYRLLSGREIRMLDDALRNVEIAVVGYSAMVGDPKFPEPALRDPAHTWASSAQEQTGESTSGALQQYLVRRCAEFPPYSASLAEDVLDHAWDMLHGRVGNREKSIRIIERFADGWMKTLLGTNESWQSRWKARS